MDLFFWPGPWHGPLPFRKNRAQLGPALPSHLKMGPAPEDGPDLAHLQTLLSTLYSTIQGRWASARLIAPPVLRPYQIGPTAPTWGRGSLYV